MKNIIERFKKEKIAVCCKTKNQAILFIKLCYENNLKWEFCDFGSETINWGPYDKEMCYEYDDSLYYGTAKCFKSMNYEIISFEDLKRK